MLELIRTKLISTSNGPNILFSNFLITAKGSDVLDQLFTKFESQYFRHLPHTGDAFETLLNEEFLIELGIAYKLSPERAKLLAERYGIDADLEQVAAGDQMAFQQALLQLCSFQQSRVSLIAI